MAAWRRKAIEAFPELQRELADSEEIFSIYALWFALLPLARNAHREGNDDLLRRIYGFAEWSSQQGGELSNAVAVSFYEHLFDEPWMRRLVVAWLTDKVIHEMRSLWKARLTSADMAEVDDLVRRRDPTAARSRQG